MLIGPVSPKRYQFTTISQIGVAVGLLSITAFFTALVMVYALLFSAQTRTARITVPVSLWVSTALLLASSAALEAARYSLRRARLREYRVRISTTTALGVGFLCSQIYSWWNLAEQGVYMRSNPHGSVFYVFTGAHGLHLFTGVLCLVYLRYRAERLAEDAEQDLRRHRASSSAVALYWHFMDVLWLVLFALLCQWNK
jgi:cytochrome c oxidase subunit 3